MHSVHYCKQFHRFSYAKPKAFPEPISVNKHLTNYKRRKNLVSELTTNLPAQMIG